MKKVKERYVMLCHHCGNEAPHNLIHYHSLTEEIYDQQIGPYGIEYHYFLVKCETCEGIALLGSAEYEDFPLDWSQAHMLYPPSKELAINIPEKVRKTYLEASRICKIAPNAYAGQIGRALEYLCMNKKAKGHRLQEKIKDLVDRGIIPPIFAQAINEIRILRNIGVHASDMDLTPSDVDIIEDFFKAILEYIYIAPNKIEKLKKRLTEAKK